VRPALERTLGDLGLEQLDLYLMHWPVAQRRGVAMPSSAADQLGLAQVPLAATARIQPEVLQVERHPLLQQNELLSYCHASGIQLTGYAPLGASNDNRPPVVLQHPVVAAIAAERQITSAQVLLAWGIGSGTAVIPKSVHPKRLAENLAAAPMHLDDNQMARLAAIDEGQRLIDGRFWCLEGGPYTMENLWDAGARREGSP